MGHAKRRDQPTSGQVLGIYKGPDLGIGQLCSMNWGKIGKGQTMQYPEAIIKNLALVSLSM